MTSALRNALRGGLVALKFVVVAFGIVVALSALFAPAILTVLWVVGVVGFEPTVVLILLWLSVGVYL